MPFATTPDGANIYYEVVGEGPPLLLFSGQGCDHHAWDSIRDQFSPSLCVIVFDYRGTGQSPLTGTVPLSTRLLAQDAVYILDQLQIPRTHVYGVSMGGRVCQWFGIDFPTRVSAVVLGCTTPGNLHGVQRPRHVHELLSTASYSDSRLMDTLVSPLWAQSHPEYLRKLTEANEHPISDEARRQHWNASESHDSWEELPRLAAPTLILHGTEDIVNMTANAYLLQSRIPNSALRLLPGGRHCIHYEYSQEIAEIIREFLGSIVSTVGNYRP
jgi:3-oxoadipate enol-lactonase